MDRTEVQTRPTFCNDVYTVQFAKTCGPPTILGGTELVEVPHYEFSVSRTREDLVVVAWVSAEMESSRSLPLRPRLTPATPSNVSADALHFEPTSSPQIARRIEAMTPSTNSGLMIRIK